MVHYRRARTPGGTYFFTVALRDRSSDALIRHVAELRKAIRSARTKQPFRIDAMVVLPDHLHVVWTLPPEAADYSGRWRAIKSGFVRALRERGVPLRANAKGEYDVWQRRFWEHQIRDEEDFARHVDYVHINPLKHGLVAKVVDWPYSSFHQHVRRGMLPVDWAANPNAMGEFGE